MAEALQKSDEAQAERQTLGGVGTVMWFLCLVSIAVFGALPMESAQGQARPVSVLRPGERVRYLLPGAPSKFTGVVERADSAALLVRPDNYNASILLGIDSLQSLEVFIGLRSAGNGAARGAATGFLIGATLGTLATTAVWLSRADERCQDCWVSATGVTVVLSALGTLGLSMIGGVFGAASPGEIWYEISRRGRRD